VNGSRSHEISFQRQFKRGSEEFSRVLAFSDGLFAIAITLLVIGITVPTLSSSGSVSELADGLGDRESEFISYFISFAVIGRYWLAHHQFMGRLAAIDGKLIGLNLVYLAFIAFLPFPTDLIGTYFENPLAISIYAVNVALISGMELVLFWQAHRRGLMADRMPPAIFRWGAIQSASPVIFFLLSVPVAFVSTTAAVLFWLGGIPFAIISDRWRPEGTEEYF
jgi:uncharacterized membrane protein